MKRSAIASAVLLAFLCLPHAQAQLMTGSPWPKFRRDAANGGQSPATGVRGFALKWRFDTGDVSNPGKQAPLSAAADWVAATPTGLISLTADGRWRWSSFANVGSPRAVVDAAGNAYYGSPDFTLTAVGPDGAIRFARHTAGPIQGVPALRPDGSVAIASGDGNIYVFRPDGTLVWKTRGLTFAEESPTVRPDGSVLVESSNQTILDLAPDGKPAWRTRSDAALITDLALAPDGTVYAGTEASLLAVRADGSIAWNFQTGAPIESTPGVLPDGTVVFGGDDAVVRALRPNGTLRWQVSLTSGLTGPVLVLKDGSALISDDGLLHDYSADGTQRWTAGPFPLVEQSLEVAPDGDVRFQTDPDRGSTIAAAAELITLKPGGAVASRFEIGSPVLSSAAIGADGAVYVGCDNGWLYAVNADGTRRWRFQAGSTLRSSPLLLEDGTIVIGAGDGTVYAVRPDGSLRWRFAEGGTIEASPALVDGEIVIGSDSGELVALGADGKAAWQMMTGGPVASSAAVRPDGTFVVGVGHTLQAYKSDGTPLWSLDLGDVVASSAAVAADGTSFIGAENGNFEAVSAAGKSLWSFTAMDAILGPAALLPGGGVVVASQDANLTALNADGSQRWQLVEPNVAPFQAGPVALADGRVVAASEDGEVLLVNSDGSLQDSYTTLAGVFACPAVTPDGTTVVGSADGGLYALASGLPPFHFLSGPSQANKSATSVDIVFTTDQPGTGTVEYGPDGLYGRTVTESSSGTRHRLTLTGLAPRSQYHFRVTVMGPGARTTQTSDDFLVTPCPAGDVNGDGRITVGDAVLALRVALGAADAASLNITPQDLLARADLNGDGKVDVGDAVEILRVAVGLEPNGCP